MVQIGGVYKHYKGVLYRVLMVGLESTNGRTRDRLVIYISDAQHNVCVRKESEFLEPIKWPDGVVRPRFHFQGT